MKNNINKKAVLTAFGSIVFATLLIFSMTACDNGSGGGGKNYVAGTLVITVNNAGEEATTASLYDTLTAYHVEAPAGVTYQWYKDNVAEEDKTALNYGTASTVGTYKIVASLAGFDSISASITVTTSGSYNLGDTGPGGGKIFYKSTTGFTFYQNTSDTTGEIFHYLEAAPEDLDLATGNVDLWGVTDNINGTGTAIGTGKKNTALMISYSTPASLCNSLDTGGKNDWFIPSKDELNQLYTNRTHVGNMGTSCYWSSSESTEGYVWYQDFSNGAPYHTTPAQPTYTIRPIRAFF